MYNHILINKLILMKRGVAYLSDIAYTFIE